MNKEEQIEEMTKERNEIKDIMKLLDKCVSLNPMCKSEVASVLYGNNYRKLPEDSVVLSREEYEMLKTCVKEFAEKIKAQSYVNDYCREVVEVEKIDELIKELIKNVED